jgi:hypothetical protein
MTDNHRREREDDAGVYLCLWALFFSTSLPSRWVSLLHLLQATIMTDPFERYSAYGVSDMHVEGKRVELELWDLP